MKMKKERSDAWTKEELETLKKFYPISSTKEIGRLIPDRSRTAIIAKASKLKVKKIVPVWTEEEYALLKKYYPSNTNNTDLLKLIPKHSFVSIKTKAKLLGLRRGQYLEYKADDDTVYRKWTLEEINILKDYYNLMSDREVIKMLPGRTIMGMKHAVRKLGLGRKEIKHKIFTNTHWTMRENLFLIENFSKLPNVELMKFLSGRTLVAIKARAQKLGLKRGPKVWGFAGEYQPWKKHEIALLKKNWKKKSVEEIATMINRSIEGIKKQAKKMGLRK